MNLREVKVLFNPVYMKPFTVEQFSFMFLGNLKHILALLLRKTSLALPAVRAVKYIHDRMRKRQSFLKTITSCFVVM